jgi:excisionase family DNA binding protein
MDPAELMTVSEVARMLRLSEAAVYGLCKSGQLAHHRLGQGRSAIRIDRADVLAYLQQSRREATPGAGSPPSSDRTSRGASPAAGGFKHLRLDRLLGGQPPGDEPSSGRGDRNAR